jgi:ketosteroid isomerase-like protein
LRPAPVRALERGTPFIRRLPAPRDDGRRASRPTFDLSESSWATAATIRSLEKRWAAAVKNHDVNALDQLLADNFSGTSATGAEAGKERMLSLLRRDTNRYTSTRVRDMSVRNLGATKAVVTGVATESGVTEDGRKFRASRRFTDTWRQVDGRWQCVASRVTQAPSR